MARLVSALSFCPKELVAFVEQLAATEQTSVSETCALLVDLGREVLEASDPLVLALALEARKQNTTVVGALIRLAEVQLEAKYPTLMAELRTK